MTTKRDKKMQRRRRRADELTRVIMDGIMAEQGVRGQFRDGYAVTFARVADTVDRYVVRDARKE